MAKSGGKMSKRGAAQVAAAGKFLHRIQRAAIQAAMPPAAASGGIGTATWLPRAVESLRDAAASLGPQAPRNVSAQLVYDYAEFLTWLMGHRIVKDNGDEEWEVRHLSDASIQGKISAEPHVDWCYDLIVEAWLLDAAIHDPGDWVDSPMTFTALTVPLTARAEDGWRPYYARRQPSWQPGKGIHMPIFRARSGQFTVFDAWYGDLWRDMRVNPRIIRYLDGKATLKLSGWVAVADLLRHEQVPGYEEFTLHGSLSGEAYCSFDRVLPRTRVQKAHIAGRYPVQLMPDDQIVLRLPNGWYVMRYS